MRWKYGQDNTILIAIVDLNGSNDRALPPAVFPFVLWSKTFVSHDMPSSSFV